MTDLIPTIEELMSRLEKMGMAKQASELRDIASSLGMGFGPNPMQLKQRQMHSKGIPPARNFTHDPKEKMLQEGERYTEINPQTGIDTTQRYKYQQPLPTSKLQPYFQKGMFDTDFAEEQMRKETDPDKKEMWRHLLETAQQNEKQMRVLQASEAMCKCASDLRQKGYDALADRIESKVAAVYKPGKGVRIRSLKEFVEESKGEKGDKTDLYADMFDKYVRVLEGAVNIVKMAQTQSKNITDMNEAVKLVVTADQLLMNKLLEIGELTALSRGEGI